MAANDEAHRKIIQANIVSLAHLAHPYSVSLSVEDGVARIVLTDDETDKSVALRGPSVTMAGSKGVERMSKVLVTLKEKLQAKLVLGLDQPEIRLWAAKTLSLDLMDGSKIPNHVMVKYTKAHATTGVTGIPKDKDRQSYTPPLKLKLSQEETAEMQARKPIKKAELPGKRTGKPRSRPCPVHTQSMMDYVPDRGLFKCMEPGCRQISRPKAPDTGQGDLVLGRGNVSLTIVVGKEGERAMFLLVADNGVAIPIDTNMIQNLDGFISANDLPNKLSAASNGPTPGRVTTQSVVSLSLTSLRINVIEERG
jgi:hypothetical protein